MPWTRSSRPAAGAAGGAARGAGLVDEAGRRRVRRAAGRLVASGASASLSGVLGGPADVRLPRRREGRLPRAAAGAGSASSSLSGSSMTGIAFFTRSSIFSRYLARAAGRG